MLRFFRGAPLWLKLIGIAGCLLWLVMLANGVARLFNPGAHASDRFPLPAVTLLILIGMVFMLCGTFLWLTPHYLPREARRDTRVGQVFISGLVLLALGMVLTAEGMIPVRVVLGLPITDFWIGLVAIIAFLGGGVTVIAVVTNRVINGGMPPSSRL